MTGTTVHFDDVKLEGAANIRTSLGTIGAGDTVRVDAIQRMEGFNEGRWSPGVAIYFDTNNWIQLHQTYSNGAEGFIRQGAINGNLFAADGDDNVTPGDIRYWYLIAGVELTPTEIRFYGSSLSPLADHFGETDVDSNVSIIPELTMARPASFVGDATAIIGKGISTPGGTAYMQDAGGDETVVGDFYIDFARINVVPEPGSLGLLTLGGLALFVRSRRRQA